MTTLFRTAVVGVLVLGLAVAVTACGRGRQTPTPTPEPAPTTAAAPAAAPTDTPAPVAQPESPLVQAESPLSQPDSPLTTLNPNEIVANQARPVDRAALVDLVASTTAPEPQEGMAAVSAVLYSYSVNQPIGNTVAYLTPADIVDGTPVPPSVYFGPKPENGDVNTQSNEQGQFFLDNVPPGDYYLAVWTVYDWPAAFSSPDDFLPILISVQAGDRLDLGLLYVDWP